MTIVLVTNNLVLKYNNVAFKYILGINQYLQTFTTNLEQ